MPCKNFSWNLVFLELGFVFGDDSWIGDDTHIIGTLYYRDIFQCIQILLAQYPFQAGLGFEPVRIADAAGPQVFT